MNEEREYPFEFSVVMAVYNVEPFLREAVDSLVQQDFGFEKIQLIMVDDGSTDGSGAICDEYAAQYPKNVMVIHKENGGVSAARNDGMKYVQGRYVNFLDSDDKFSEDTFSSVYEFFINNEKDTDVVAVPRFYFDGKIGEHDLNYRFRKGTRLIDLRKDYTAIQNTSSTAFFSRQGLEGIWYETGLAYCEDIAARHVFVYLQHGVIKDDLSKLLGRYKQNIRLFVSVTQPEYDSIMEYPYYYDETMLKITGFPRYDLLYHDEKKYITIMPTWRAYLVGGLDPKTGKRPLKPGFEDSHYYQIYHKLLNCDRLFDAAERMGYRIRFLDHPNMSAAARMIKADPRLVYLPEDTAYRTIFAESDLLLTDFSSIAFDFAYLRKPVVYFQEDIGEFYSGAHTYDKGYFEYERDGFGEVIFDGDKLVDCLIGYMENGCQLKPEYRARIDQTFPYSDQNNSQRVYEKIVELEESK